MLVRYDSEKPLRLQKCQDLYPPHWQQGRTEKGDSVFSRDEIIIIIIIIITLLLYLLLILLLERKWGSRRVGAPE
jgi:hypothetical protein